MPTLNPLLIPTIVPGNLFENFTENSTYNVRWIVPGDPVHYQAMNRPMADIVVRQLIMAKALDGLSTDIGYLALFPFVNQPQLTVGSTSVNIPIRLFWDMHVSVPSKWVNLKLARVDRLDGTNGSGTYDGTIRFIFTANEEVGGATSTDEIALFYADYEIDSGLTYQIVAVNAATTATVPSLTVIDTGEIDTIGGTIIFRTGDQDQSEISSFYDLIAPGSTYQYTVTNSAGATDDGDFSADPVTYGTGLLTSSAYNSITTQDSDPQTWIESINYPFDLDATLTSNDGNNIVIPRGLFREFNITIPAGDLATGNTTGLQYPCWINKIERDGDDLIFYFSTYNVTDTAPSTSSTIEFATLTLQRTMVGGQIIAIIPTENLLLEDDTSFGQHFGRGHVTLSKVWDVSGGDVDDFFDSFAVVTGSVTTATYARAATRVSAYGTSRVPKYVPTIGQSQALRGTTDSWTTPILPSSNNRYVTEADEGLGNTIDLEAESGITAHDAVERYGYAATNIHKMVKLVVDVDAAGAVPNFYENELLPRLTILFGRAPVFGDEWYDGVSFKRFNGNTWIS